LLTSSKASCSVAFIELTADDIDEELLLLTLTFLFDAYGQPPPVPKVTTASVPRDQSVTRNSEERITTA
jgi:hypothetical protein